MKLRPLQDCVLIRRFEAEAKTAGGIFIPDTGMLAFSIVSANAVCRFRAAL